MSDFDETCTHTTGSKKQLENNRPTACIMPRTLSAGYWWAGRDNATLPEPASSHANCPKTRTPRSDSPTITVLALFQGSVWLRPGVRCRGARRVGTLLAIQHPCFINNYWFYNYLTIRCLVRKSQTQSKLVFFVFSVKLFPIICKVSKTPICSACP
jgi:hypothetical protein